MCCRNFFRVTLICSAFQALLGSSVMAEEVSQNVVASSNIESSSNQSVENKEANDSASSSTGDSKIDDNMVEVSILFEKEQPVKEVKIQISLDQENNDSVNSDYLSDSDEVIGQKAKDYFQKMEMKDVIVSKVQSLRNSINEVYSQSDSEDRKLLEFLKSCTLKAEIVGDDEKTLQIDLESPTPVKETVLLEKTSLDEKNNRFVEINLINR